MKGLCTAIIVPIRLNDATTYYSPPHHPLYDSQPSSYSPPASESPHTPPLRCHTLIRTQRVSWAVHTCAEVELLPGDQGAIDEVGLYHPGRLIEERDIGSVVLDVGVEKGFAGTVGGREGG